MTFAFRARLETVFGPAGVGLTLEQIGYAFMPAFWGFTIAMVVGGPIVDFLGMRKGMIFAFVLHFVGIVATLMAGVILVGLGVAGLGAAIKFIPHPVVTGFTSGIALIIFSSQVKDLLGLRMGEVPAEFFQKWQAFADNIGSANPRAMGVAALSLGGDQPADKS